MSARGATLLEQGFPFDVVAQLVAADLRSPDPAYQAHRWWARRPPALMRAALLASQLPVRATTTLWARYRATGPHLAGVTVLDPFLGGGTVPLEASRLGADVIAQDIDPVAVRISRHQLGPADPVDVESAGDELFAHLHTTIGELWPALGDETPLHYFTLAEAVCPQCACSQLLFRSLVIARSIGKDGAVVRDAAQTVFCPDCLQLHDLPADSTDLSCCGPAVSLSHSTYRKGRWECPGCEKSWGHEQLATGAADRRLIAVELTGPLGRRARRTIRPPADSDHATEQKAREILSDLDERGLGDVVLYGSDADKRPVSLGLKTFRDLFTTRQWVYLLQSRAWIDEANLEEGVKDTLRLAVSSTIVSNNRLCGYATDYGRLAPLFSVRAFSLPALTVELAPLHPRAGRGTLQAALGKTIRSAQQTSRRHVVDVDGHIRAHHLSFKRSETYALTAGDSSVEPSRSLPHTGNDSEVRAVCLTDPPFYDFIPYDTLAQVFKPWLGLGGEELDGTPLLPCGDDPVGQFGRRLAGAFRNCVAGRPHTMVAFTYKGGAAAWEAVGVALDEAKLAITALWPVLADPHMGHHATAGNCEYDVLVVARPAADTVTAGRADRWASRTRQQWVRRLTPVHLPGAADRAMFGHALAMARPRWATVSPNGRSQAATHRSVIANPAGLL